MKLRLLLCLLAIQSATAQRGGLGGAFNWDEPAAPPAQANPAPAPPANPAPQPTAPAPLPPQANPEIAAKITALRRMLAERERLTAESIQPLASLDAATERALRYRRLVDRTLRQPFLAGLNPSPDLTKRVGEMRARWGSLAGAIRAGKPPASVAAATLAALKLPDMPAAADAPMTGSLWAKLSDAYFTETLELESLGAGLAAQVRRSENMRALASLMDMAEQQLTAPAAGAPDLRRITWRLHRVWMLGAELQIKLLEREAVPDAATEGVAEFLRDMDAARGLRHRGLSLSRAGGAPPPGDAPAVLVRAPADGTICAALAGTEASVDVAPPAANLLPQLAEELYHTHYTLLRVEDFERETDSLEKQRIAQAIPGPEREAREREHAESRTRRIAERRSSYAGRRLQVLHEMEEEATRVLNSR